MVNFNLVSTKNLEIDYDEPYCTRAKLDTGPLCNYNCSFCYYQGDLHKKTSLEVIAKRLQYIVDCGITEVDLSGGESSLHPQWFELLDMCKSHNLKISTLSNGYKFADMEFLKQSKEHGLEEILFSIHGFDSESHDKIVDHKYAFNKIIKAANNAKELGMVVRVNCVVTKDNYMNLSSDFVPLMLSLGPLEVNFLTLNYWGNVTELETIPYKIVTDKIKEAIDGLKDNIEYINVRYTPYCYMQGYEKYVCNTYQHIYDLYDWNMAVYNQNLTPEEYKQDNLKELYAAAERGRIKTYKKTIDCTLCKYFFICDGMEKKINDPVVPVDGSMIKNVNFFRKGFYENKRSNPNT